MKKLVYESIEELNEGMYDSQEEYYRMMGADEGSPDNEEYWEAVADAMGGHLVSFDMGEYWREIEIGDVAQAGRTSGTVHIKHDWREDGTETKPWTYVNGDDRYGRVTIWEDEPGDYAEDILGML